MEILKGCQDIVLGNLISVTLPSKTVGPDDLRKPFPNSIIL